MFRSSRFFRFNQLICAMSFAGTVIVFITGCAGESANSVSGPRAGNAERKSLPNDSKTNARQSDWLFSDVAKTSGVDFTATTGYLGEQFTLLETLGTGVAILDADLDGRPDVFLPGGGLIEKGKTIHQRAGFFRNLGAFQFQNATDSAAIPVGEFYTQGAVVGDHNNDGFPDLLVTGFGGTQFLCNQGDGTFQQQTLPGVDDHAWSTGGAWADVNGDGMPDLYLAHYIDWSWDNHPACGKSWRDICPPRTFRGLDDAIYLNNGDGTYANATSDSGLSPAGKGLGVLICDFDMDSDLDIYVANDTVRNFMYFNDGKGHFEEKAKDSGTAAGAEGSADGSMGLGLCDYNCDGLFDLWVTNFQHEIFALYRNESNGFYDHASLASGVAWMGPRYVGWGTAWQDFDLDGDEDVVVANGHIQYQPNLVRTPQRPVLMHNRDSRMIQVKEQFGWYFAAEHHGRGLAASDLDSDGDVDIVVTNADQPVAVLKNEVKRAGSWLAVRLHSRTSPRIPFGATLKLVTKQGTQIRQLQAGGSYMSQHDQTIHWGLASGDTVRKLSIVWPSGIVQHIVQEIVADSEAGNTGLQAEQLLHVVEPKQ